MSCSQKFYKVHPKVAWGPGSREWVVHGALTLCGSAGPPLVLQGAPTTPVPVSALQRSFVEPSPLHPPAAEFCGLRGVGRGPKPGQRTVSRHLIRSPGVRLALLAGVDEVRGTVSLEPLVQPSRVSMPAARLTRERLSDDSGGRGSGHRVPRGCRARSRGSGDTSVPWVNKLPFFFFC